MTAPLAHDTPAEIAQPAMRDWSTGEVEAIPGKTMPALKVVTRNYKDLYRQYISLGPLVRENGLGAHGTHYKCDDYYDELVARRNVRWNGKAYPSIESDVDACNAVLTLASVTNGELAYRSYKNMEERVGLPLAHLAEKSRSVRMSYEDLQTRPHRYLSSPMWSGLIEYGRAYSPYTYNHDALVPWRTLPKPTPTQYADLRVSEEVGPTLMLNFLTPHGKWHIHSTYGDNQRMTTLSRGCEPFWINDKDAASIDIQDNDWVEIHNDHGVLVTRACVSVRIPRGICIVYHSPERTYGVPKSPLRGNRRAGGHNSVTRTRLKPNLMVGGYGQFTYHFNYWGPIGCNRDTHIYVRKLPRLIW